MGGILLPFDSTPRWRGELSCRTRDAPQETGRLFSSRDSGRRAKWEVEGCWAEIPHRAPNAPHCLLPLQTGENWGKQPPAWGRGRESRSTSAEKWGCLQQSRALLPLQPAWALAPSAGVHGARFGAGGMRLAADALQHPSSAPACPCNCIALA